MKSVHQAINKTCIGFMLGCSLAVPVYADDIEIYTDANLVGPVAQPNIMFIMDSSVNMKATLPAPERYDYTRTYDTAGGYVATRIYYTADGSIPAANGDYFDWAANNCQRSLEEYVPESYTYTDTDTAIDLVTGEVTVTETIVTVSEGWQGANTGSLYTTGMYSGQIAQFNAASTKLVWDSLNKNNTTGKVECIQDHGLHGEKNTSAVNYIINSSGGWTSQEVNSDAGVVWANNANNYVLFAGNYLNYLVDPAMIPPDDPIYHVSLFDQLKNAIGTLVLSASNINIGLMQYDGRDDPEQGSEGGSVQYPVQDVNLGRNDFYSRLKTMNTGNDPVIAETYFEALKYFGGKEVYFGASGINPSTNGDAKDNSGFYVTPITETCQKNYIIVVSNGLSQYDYIDQAERDSIPGFDSGSCNTGSYAGLDSNQDAFDTDGSTIDNCLDEMAGWALNNDIAERSFPAHVGDQNITTYTVGFAFPTDASDELKAGEQLLRDTATKGGGRFMAADNEADLVRALNQLVSEILKVNSTFSSPAVSVNAFNRATNLEDLYFTLFKPTDGEHWEGNLKKFKLEFDTGHPFVADKNSNPAIDDATGFFKESSVSYWTAAADAPDGAETAKGGAASKIGKMASRISYTFTGTYSGTTGVLTPSNGDLTLTTNYLKPNNTNITDAMLGGIATYPDVQPIWNCQPTTYTYQYRTALLRWAAGQDIKDDNLNCSSFDARREMGDPLHAEPALVQYGLTAGGVPDLVAYVATNDGYLHAFDSLTGEENFAFVPQEMLPKLQNIFDNTGVNGKAYGLDGNVVAWINDHNRDGTIAGADEHVYLYFGMRRGGRYLYSMDVTDRNNPKLRWVLEGGTVDYAEMGQTWSAPNVENIKMGGVERTVLIFGAGYDTGQDVLTTRGTDSVGRGIFIVDADSGELLWRAGPDGGADLQLLDMKYSIPARITPIDVDGDGYTDRLYAGDMGGQLWRIDIINADSSSTSISATGGRIADLAIDGSVNDNRRFYNSPDVAMILEEGRAPYLSIVAASGYRAHPLQTDTHDRAYMIRDNNVYDAPASYTTLTEANDLFDTTNNAIGEGSQFVVDQAKLDLSTAQGWYINFNEMDGTFVGEKALSEPLILDGVAVFTTFIPASAGLTNNSCKANDGTGAIYFVNVVDGTPTKDNSDDGNVTREDRRILLARGGIPPTPRVIITKDGIPTLCVGTECSKAGEVGTTQKMYWYEIEE